MTVDDLIALGCTFVGGQIDLNNKNIGINTPDGPVIHSGLSLPTPSNVVVDPVGDPVVRRGRRSAMALPEDIQPD